MYEQLGYKAFGMPGKLAASCSITMQNIGGEGGRQCWGGGGVVAPGAASSSKSPPQKTFPNTVVCVSAAMSSYLYIVKYELPIVIQAFLGSGNG